MKDTSNREIFIGLISGTSTDAIDAVAVSFLSNGLHIHQQHSHPIPQHIKEEIIKLNMQSKNELHLALTLDQILGALFAEAVGELLKKAKLDKTQIRAIGSHGQTLRHHISSAPFYTFQIADPNIIAELSGITTVADFRRRDIAAGGQGAPLVPAFHETIFKIQQNKPRIILNIGGMSNITILWADNRDTEGFDTGPGNVLLDMWIAQHKNLPYDDNGQWANSGKVNQKLLEQLLQESFLQQQPPKSTGRDLFNWSWLNQHLQAAASADKPENIQATLAEYTSQTIASAILMWGPESGEIFVCGGGVHNQYLMASLTTKLDKFQIQSTAELGLDPDSVEACAFAWLARQTIMHETGNLPAVTGARRKTILGGIYQAG